MQLISAQDLLQWKPKASPNPALDYGTRGFAIRGVIKKNEQKWENLLTNEEPVTTLRRAASRLSKKKIRNIPLQYFPE